jgi:hypothetical protein
VVIAFKNIKSFMQGTLDNGKIVFRDIPVNEPVKIVGISYLNGSARLGVEETTIDKDGYALSKFDEFTLDQLEQELNKLD